MLGATTEPSERRATGLASRLSHAAGVSRLLTKGWLLGLDVGQTTDAALAASTIRLGLEERVSAVWRARTRK